MKRTYEGTATVEDGELFLDGVSLTHELVTCLALRSAEEETFPLGVRVSVSTFAPASNNS